MAVSITIKEEATETALHREWATLRVLFHRLANAILNRVFALDVKGAHHRQNVLRFLFVLSGIIIVLILDPWSKWSVYLNEIFSALFSLDAVATTKAVSDLFSFVRTAIIDPRLISLLPVFILPFILSHHFAANYLADIFEIEDIDIARKFISEVALQGGNNELHISISKMDEKEIEKSPIVRIGGPGYVTVELDTALLLEKPDGRPRVIGPTYSGKAVLDGFERIRDIIDLRDQVPNALEVGGRSLDGIPINIQDVRVVFNIYRGNKKQTTQEPHPFSEEAFRKLVYGKAHRVTEGERIHESWFHSSGEPTLMMAMKSLVTGELGAFISKRKLGEYLASIGVPEVQRLQEIETAITRDKQNLTGTNHLEPPDAPPIPDFTTRSKLSSLLSDFTKEFNEKEKGRGVQAQWVGVGTWKMPPGVPSQVIPEKHLEAWRLTLENQARGSKQALDILEKESALSELQQIIIKGPIQTYRIKLTENLSKIMMSRELTAIYINRLSDVIEKIRKTRQRIPPSSFPPSLVVAYYYLLRLFSHGPEPQIPAPTSEEERKLYALALSKIEIPIALERLILLENELDPDLTRTECLRRIIRAWDTDMQVDTRQSSTPPGGEGRGQARPETPGGGQAGSKGGVDTDKSSPSEADLYNNLLNKVHGEAALAERLIDFERRHFPSGNRQEWIRRAIQRLERDNR